MNATRKPLVAHVLFRFDYGGMENGIVNLVNGLPPDEFAHAIIALTEVTAFGERIQRRDVQVHALHKRAGKDWGAYWRLYRLLRRLRPAIVHTRNIGTLDCVLIAWLAGVPLRVHGEHGWDVHDPDGSNRKYLWLRRLLSPWVSHFVTVSADLHGYLCQRVGIAARHISHICNGVNTQRFSPRGTGPVASLPAERFPAGCVVVGSTTRFNAIKDPLNLIKAFIALRQQVNGVVDVRLLMVGDGPLREAALQALQVAGVAVAAWLPGSRDDIPDLLRAMDVYVLGSLREGISNTLLESMATGMPLLATATGGNVELIEPGVVGALVPVADAPALTAALLPYVYDAALRQRHGQAARARAERDYSLARMLGDYRNLYRSLLGQAQQ